MILNMVGGGVDAGLPKFTYTGSYQLVDDGKSNGRQNWRLKLLTSGTLKFSRLGSGAAGAQVFLVGAGGGGSSANANERSGGGGGGYTATFDATLPLNQGLTVTIGAGSAGARGGTSSLVCSAAAINLSAAGGYPGVSNGAGGNGGSGGGGSNNANGSAGPGGSDGAGGAIGSGGDAKNGGQGQGVTTREFGEASGALYAGGGGGGFGNSAAGRAGGSGGGGTGGGWSTPFSTNGVVNTGGGAGGNGHATGAVAAGGSGIIIIRNRR